MSFALRYPLSAIEPNTSYMVIRVMQKSPTQFDKIAEQDVSNLNFAATGDDCQRDVFGDNKKVIKGSIMLPMPLGVGESNSVKWADSSLNALEQLGASSSMRIMNTALEGGITKENASKFIGILGSTAEEELLKYARLLENPTVSQSLKTALTANILKLFGSNVNTNQLLSRTTGQVLNPHLELLFEGVNLRTHSFQYMMTPRNRNESNQVKRIINIFKRSMAAKSSGDGPAGLFIRNPDVFQVEFRKGSRKHPFLYSMKTCALKNIDVNYTDSSSQNYSSYYDGTPISLTMKLDFTELSPVYNEDYDEDFSDDILDNGVGY